MDSKTEKRFVRLSHGKSTQKIYLDWGVLRQSHTWKKKKKEKDIYIYEPLLKTDSNTIKNNVIIIMILFVGEKYLSLRFVAF